MSITEQEFLATLCQGAVYFIPTRVSSANFHYCIVMNEHPGSDELVLLEIISSQVDKTKLRILMQSCYSESSAVELDPAKVAFLHKPSIVDCNFCLELSKGLLIQDLRNARSTYAGKIPQDILKKLITETMASKGLRPKQKRLINLKQAQFIEKRQLEIDQGLISPNKITITVK